MTLPSFGHLRKDRGFRAGEPLGRVTYLERGRHLILGQRENRGSMESLIFLGKCGEHTKTQDKYDANVWLDVSFPHVIFLSGTRGSGKSFDIGVILEGLMLSPSARVSTPSKPAAAVVFDLQNQFWTLSRKPDKHLGEDQVQIELLKEWSLEPAALDGISLFIPPGGERLIGSEEELVLSASDLTSDDLCSFWDTDVFSPQGHVIATVIEKVGTSGYTATTGQSLPAKAKYGIADLIQCLVTDSDISANTNSTVVDALLWRFESIQRLDIFRETGIAIEDLLRPGKTVVLLLRSLDDASKGLITGLLLRKIYGVMGAFHTKRKVYRRLGKTMTTVDSLPERVWCVVDEAHVVCPVGRETSATRAMIEYVKRGRDAGLSLLLATQQPSAIDTRVLSQVDLTLIHRLTFDGDIAAALARIPASLPNSFLLGTAEKDPRMLVRLLESGEAIIGDSQADRAFVGVVRPRLTAHGGADPK